ncbi:hypothetical protein [Clostridium sp. ZBS15]|uniref:hypothetical protein n=1 Tax=Clostridium sp. ZBS15 TaxID=2949969 RepID=UPI00207B0A05|nr:hypothetical protein [Clostridium sp. ZBS15]
MQNKISILNVGNKLGGISLGIPIIVFMFILNWLFDITAYQKFEGMPLMLAPYICSIGVILALISRKLSDNKLWKIGIIFNILLIIAPFLYWHLGTLIFGV